MIRKAADGKCGGVGRGGFYSSRRANEIGGSVKVVLAVVFKKETKYYYNVS